MSRFDTLREPEVRQQQASRQARENRQEYAQRDRNITLSKDEVRVMRIVGTFRTVNAQDLPAVRLNRLMALRLVHRHVVYQNGAGSKVPVLTLTRKGRELIDSLRDAGDPQRFWAGLVKPSEIGHDAAIYPACKEEVEAIEKAGGKVRRVVLDYELKSAINSRMNQKHGPDKDTRRAQLGKEYSLPVVEGKLALPDLRIEYEDAEGREQHQDLEITTRHYKGAHTAGKAKSGFKLVRAGGRSESTVRTSVNDDHRHGWAK